MSQPGIVDIDFSPVNGALYGATADGSLYTINIFTGVAALAVTPASSLGTVTDIDFNPAADRVRVFSEGDQNYRLTPDASAYNNPGLTAGAVTNDGAFSDPAVSLVGSAYTNPVDGTAVTTLYSIDNTSNSLIRHENGPAFSTVTVVGSLGVDPGPVAGFDIGSDGIAWLSAGNDLYSVNLQTGSATAFGAIGGLGATAVRSIASAVTVVPVPEASVSSALLLTGLAAMGRRRRK
ncbi:MAG: DUF4394 domain-containing protein [Verrucomicrobiaceae bacterium]|nr:MAG: DUF4394 domain-containing protein [Verrucomicrobiaceae bacterium]